MRSYRAAGAWCFGVDEKKIPPSKRRRRDSQNERPSFGSTRDTLSGIRGTHAKAAAPGRNSWNKWTPVDVLSSTDFSAENFNVDYPPPQSDTLQFSKWLKTAFEVYLDELGGPWAGGNPCKGVMEKLTKQVRCNPSIIKTALGRSGHVVGWEGLLGNVLLLGG